MGRFLEPDPIGFLGGVNFYAYVGNCPVNFVDPMGLCPPKNKPKYASVVMNAKEAENMSLLDFYFAVRGGGRWDYKLSNEDWEDFGNYNFGYTGRAAGIDPDTLRRGAGAYQIITGKSDPKWGFPWWKAPYGDQPKDQYWINLGIKHYDEGYYNKNNYFSSH